MDPKSALDQLRAWAAHPVRETRDDTVSWAMQAAEAFAYLDNWMTNGGARPQGWAKGRQ